MTDLHWLAVALFFSVSPLAGAIVYLAHKVRGMMTVNVTQPPITVNQPPITVQAPTALIPEHVTELLRLIEEKLTPEKPAASDEQLRALVEEGVKVAEGSPLKGADKFRIAREYVEQRAAAANVTVDGRDLALRIEAAVKTVLP